MNVFKDSARIYDLLYHDKDYVSEAAYVAALIRRYNPQGLTILELGCGTGRHAELLVAQGFTVHGIDRSPEMLEAASARALDGQLSFSSGDACSLRLQRRFDAVIALFHVVSYQTDNQALAATFATAAAHLDIGGIFVFDFWYGPAVLTQRPEARIRRLEGEGYRIVRFAEPLLQANANTVTVSYEYHVIEKATSRHESYVEQHEMRYLFLPEIQMVAEMNSMSMISAHDFMTDAQLGCGTWNACCVCVKM